MNPKGLAFGYNNKGQLGLGNYQNRNVPTKINSIKVKFVLCCKLHTVLIAQTLRVHPEDMNNNVLLFGYNINRKYLQS